MLIQNILQEGTWVDHYRIVRRLGRGGFGITYLAQEFAQAEEGGGSGQPLREVAMKEYFPNGIATRPNGHTVAPIHDLEGAEVAFRHGLKAFFAEAQALAQLDHENIVPIHRVFERNGTAYFVMPFLRGESLRAVLRREGSLSEERTRRLLLPVLNGLAYAHARGILHRDIKPDNVMIRESDGRPLLIDFGTARAETATDSQQYTRYSELVAYTPGYAAFEQYGRASRQNLHGPHTDVYGLAAMMYEAITGEAPVESATRAAEMHADSEDPLVPASARLLDTHGYSRAFLAAVDWGLELAAKDRPQNLNDFRKALDGKLALPEKTLQRIERFGGSAEAFTQPGPATASPVTRATSIPAPQPVATAAAQPRPRDTVPQAATSAPARFATQEASRHDTASVAAPTTSSEPTSTPGSGKRYVPLIGGGLLALVGLALILQSKRSPAPAPLPLNAPPSLASAAPLATASVPAPSPAASVHAAAATPAPPPPHTAASEKPHRAAPTTVKPAPTTTPAPVQRPAPAPAAMPLTALLKLWDRHSLSVSGAHKDSSLGADQCSGQPPLQILRHELSGGPQTYRGGVVDVTVTFRYCGGGKLKGRMQWRVLYEGSQLVEDDDSQSVDNGDWRTSMKVHVPSGTPAGNYQLETRFLSTGAPVTDVTTISVTR